MTELFPLLTVANVKYWYWNKIPRWSLSEIADHIGCGKSTVYSFMRREKIKARTIPEANSNRYDYLHNFEAFLKQHRIND